MADARRHRVGGFTLVELLVAVSIIGLLVSVLLPALRRARDAGKRTVCLAHIHGLGKAWEIYGSEHRVMPPLAHRQTSTDASPAGIDVNFRKISGQWVQTELTSFGPETLDALSVGGQQWLTVYHRNKIFHWSLPEVEGEWRNFGLLWASGALRNPRVFFCPSERDPDLSWETPENPWPPVPETATITTPAGFTIANHTESSFERRVALTGVQWDRVPPGVALAGDVLWRENIKTRHRRGVNVAYRAGHALFVPVSAPFEPITGGWSWINADDRARFLNLTYFIDRQSSR